MKTKVRTYNIYARKASLFRFIKTKERANIVKIKHGTFQDMMKFVHFIQTEIFLKLKMIY